MIPMNDASLSPREGTGPASDVIAIHLLRALTRYAREDRRVSLEDLSRDLGVRKADARRILTALDRRGFVDVLHMRPTMLGFAVGHALRQGDLALARSPRVTTARAA